MGQEFYETRMGHDFYFGTMPRIAKALEELVAVEKEKVEIMKQQQKSGKPE